MVHGGEECVVLLACRGSELLFELLNVLPQIVLVQRFFVELQQGEPAATFPGSLPWRARASSTSFSAAWVRRVPRTSRAAVNIERLVHWYLSQASNASRIQRPCGVQSDDTGSEEAPCGPGARFRACWLDWSSQTVYLKSKEVKTAFTSTVVRVCVPTLWARLHCRFCQLHGLLVQGHELVTDGDNNHVEAPSALTRKRISPTRPWPRHRSSSPLQSCALSWRC